MTFELIIRVATATPEAQVLFRDPVKFHKHNLEFMMKCFSDDGRFIPMAVGTDGVLVYSTSPSWKSTREKRLVTEYLKKIFAEKGVKIASLMVESWYMAKDTKELDQATIDSEMERLDKEGVAAQPDKRECLFLVTEWNGGAIVTMIEITRDWKGKPNLGEPKEMSTDERGYNRVGLIEQSQPGTKH